MKTVVHTLNSFAKTENGGNPAGVILDADALSEMEMQKIAAEVGFSECAFVQRSNIASFRVRFFTPNSEVDLCGHATIATFSLMAQKGIITPGEYTQETRAGVLRIEACRDGNIFMNQNKPAFFQEADRSEIAASLNISEAEMLAGYPAQIVSTGLKDIIVPIASIDGLLSISPDFERIAAVSKKYDAVGYHLFTMETKYSSTAHCRNFAPLLGIPEEAATGTSSGALGCYLFKHGLVSDIDAEHMVFEQGYSMQRPSEILGSLGIRGAEIVEVRVGGIARYIKC
ncbi:MAG: PhzF family phenazine biosynthesis protein [Clostridiales bacterium]|nr:PhzF family phenazine biosynthesis protein [Clostridiales bacterium]